MEVVSTSNLVSLETKLTKTTTTQLKFTSSKSTIETLEKDVKYIQS